MDIAFPHHFVSLILSVMSLLFGAKSHYCSQSLGEVEKKEIVLTKNLQGLVCLLVLDTNLFFPGCVIGENTFRKICLVLAFVGYIFIS